MGKLEGKIALITGGNSGIGLATAKRFVDEGAYVFINGRREVELLSAAKDIGKNVKALKGDVSNLDELDRIVAQIKEDKSKLDIVLYAISMLLIPFLQFTSSQSATSVRLSALGLRRDPHGSVKQIHHEELEDGEKERPSASPKIMLKQTDSGIQQLHGTGERTQGQQRRRRLLVDRPRCEQRQRNYPRRRVHRQ